MRRLLLVLSLGLIGCAPERPQPNVLLIVADTLRADKLGCYGNGGGLTPYIDQLASEGVVFEHASSHAPWTLPSMASLLTSKLPREHGAGGRLGSFTKLHDSALTLASHYQASGYQTASVVNVYFLSKDFGLTRGFGHVDERYFENNKDVRAAEETTDAALAWLGQRDGHEPFFMLAHYFDAHAVYDPPQPFRKRFAAVPDQQNEDFVFGTREQMVNLRNGRVDFKKPIIKRAEKLYDGEVAYMDGQIGRLIDGLAALGLDESTIIVFTSDHGEEFWDHGGFEHGHTVYGELTDVPLIVRWKGEVEPQRSATAVGHVDVGPTVTELSGVAPLPAASGRSLVPLLRGQPLAAVDQLAHGNFWDVPLTSLRTNEYKLVVQPEASGKPPQLFRWREDPGEQVDLASAEPDVVQRLATQLAERERDMQAGVGAALELSAERRRELQSQGYVGGDEDEE